MIQRNGLSILRVLSLMLVLTLLVPALPAPAEEQTVTLSSREIVLAREKVVQLKATVSKGAKAAISWESSNRSVARVQDGSVEGRNAGTAVITAKARFADGSEAEASCIVTVFVPALTLTVHGRQEVGVGRSIALRTKTEPANATYQDVTWSSSNTAVATVDENGVVTGVKKGTVTITARSKEPATAATKPRSGSMKITVVQPAETIEMKAEAHLEKGKTTRLTATVLPKSANNKTVKWSTSNSKVATVQGGTVTAKAGGTAIITASVTNSDGTVAAAQCLVTVQVAVTGIKSAVDQVTVDIGQVSEPVQLKFSPSDATDRSAQWIIADPDIASVDENGAVAGLRGGFTTLTAVSNDNPARSVQIPVTVNQRAEGLALTGSAIVSNGRSTILTPVFSPDNVTNRTLYWASSDEKVATVDGGVVTGTGRGQCVITAVTTDGSNLSASWEMTVNQQVLSLSPHAEGRQIVTQGRFLELEVTPLPADADDPAVGWFSSDESVATVEEDGFVTGVAPGNCAIIAYALDGGGAETHFQLAVEPGNPVTIAGIDVYDRYEDHENCLFVTPRNNNRYRTVKNFSFVVQMLEEDGTVLSSVRCDWEGDGFKSFGPGEDGKSGSWHWHDIPDIYTAPLLAFTVVSVTYTDGVQEEIPAGSRVTTTFR